MVPSIEVFSNFWVNPFPSTSKSRVVLPKSFSESNVPKSKLSNLIFPWYDALSILSMFWMAKSPSTIPSFDNKYTFALMYFWVNSTSPFKSTRPSFAKTDGKFLPKTLGIIIFKAS